MKTTTQNISKILATLVLALTVVFLYPVHANIAGKSETTISRMAGSTHNPFVESDETNPSAISVANQMLEDPNYWVNYLKNTVDPDEDVNTNALNDFDEMQNNPEYWINSLKHIVTEE